MIPKVINYCWFGGLPKPNNVCHCIESWKRHCPEYSIIEWNENNFTFSDCEFATDAYRNRKWAFVSDYARIKVLLDKGGLYCDTDVEIIKNIDDLLNQKAFIGFERRLNGEYGVNSGSLMGAEPGNGLLRLLEAEYRSLQFSEKDLEGKTCVDITTDLMIKHGLILNNELQLVLDFTVYPCDFFSTRDMDTGRIVLTENSKSIHHYDGTWADSTVVYGHQLKWKMIAKFGRALGMMMYYFQYSIYIICHDGLKKFLIKLHSKIKSR